jgi:hypothetical protein
MEERFGGFANALLAREGLVVNRESRARLLNAVADAMDDAAAMLARAAEGD